MLGNPYGFPTFKYLSPVGGERLKIPAQAHSIMRTAGSAEIRSAGLPSLVYNLMNVVYTINFYADGRIRTCEGTKPLESKYGQRYLIPTHLKLH